MLLAVPSSCNDCSGAVNASIFQSCNGIAVNGHTEANLDIAMAGRHTTVGGSMGACVCMHGCKWACLCSSWGTCRVSTAHALLLQSDSLDVSERQPAFLKDKADGLAAQGNYR